MATVSISQLPQAPSLTGAEFIEVVETGTSARATTGQVAQLASNPTVITGSAYATQAPFYADNTGTNNADSAIAAWLACGNKSLVLPPGTYLISNPQVLAAANTTLWCYGKFQASGSFSPVGGNNYALTVSGTKCAVWTPVIDGGINGNVNIADGINITGAGSAIYFPQCTHIPNSGIAINAVDSFVVQPFMTQWLSTDSQFTGSFYTADGILVNHGDSTIVGGVSRWCANCFHATSNAGTTNVIGLHMYNGTASAGVPRGDPTCILIDAGCANSIWFTSPYIDNGHVKIFNGGISLRDAFALTNAGSSFTNDADGNQNLIQIYANGNTQPFTLEATWRQVVLNSGQKLISFLPFGMNTWLGDYTGIPQLLTTPYQTLTLSPGEILIQTEEQSYPSVIPTQAIYKSGGTISQVYQIGPTGSPMVVQISNSGIAYSGAIGVNGNAAPAQVTGWGTPTGASVQNNFAGASATLGQTSAAVAEIIAALKSLGLFGS